MKNLIKRIFPIIDLILAVVSIPFGILGLLIRRTPGRHPITDKTLEKIGIYPIRDHYYEPLINTSVLRKSLGEPRRLTGIDWNIKNQTDLLEKFRYREEMAERFLPAKEDEHVESAPRKFHFGNDAFESGDADVWYSIIRHFRPGRIIEIGSGYSTLVAREALDENSKKDPNYTCEHCCIEPYEQPWLDQTAAKILRQRVEEIDPVFFKDLVENDILFIDSSHVIRPQGDVLYEYLEILPALNSGVIVHIHDIFSPRDYPEDWIKKYKRLWNEQYLLEAFLSLNDSFEILLSLNHIHHEHYESLNAACVDLGAQREPGSFYIRRR